MGSKSIFTSLVHGPSQAGRGVLMTEYIYKDFRIGKTLNRVKDTWIATRGRCGKGRVDRSRYTRSNRRKEEGSGSTHYTK